MVSGYIRDRIRYTISTIWLVDIYGIGYVKQSQRYGKLIYSEYTGSDTLNKGFGFF